ncbi:peptidoglycan-binding domain-containing protein [Streptomyces sp. NPDC059785]|uniref:peptidoglycan-binding domain-containing protein n=1 Tax=Streptomyces sp. NPDC059785 TaxID=3346945 RepID=UPI003669D7C7
MQHLVNDVRQYDGYSRPLVEDGVWGPKTRSWVGWFQSRYGLDKDCIVGKATGGSLLIHGDDYYGGYNYCYKYLPSSW